MAVIRSNYKTEKTEEGYKGKIDLEGFNIEYVAKRHPSLEKKVEESYSIKLFKAELGHRINNEDYMNEIELSLKVGVMLSIDKYKKEKDIDELGVRVIGEENEWDYLEANIDLALPRKIIDRIRQEYLKKLMGD